MAKSPRGRISTHALPDERVRESIFLLISITGQFRASASHAKRGTGARGMVDREERFASPSMINRPAGERCPGRKEIPCVAARSFRATMRAARVKCKRAVHGVAALARDLPIRILCIANHLVPIGFTLRDGAIWRQKLVSAIVITIFRSCSVCIYIYIYIYILAPRRYVHDSAVFTRTVDAPARLKISN